jgi:hypothetical protein
MTAAKTGKPLGTLRDLKGVGRHDHPGRVFATPRAQFGFHAGYYEFLVFWKVIKPQAVYLMYRRYPDDVKSWVDSH